MLEDTIYGPRLLPRANLPAAADVPTLSRLDLGNSPANDSDAAAQIFYPFGQLDTGTDPIPKARLSKQWLCSFSEALRARGYGQSLRLSSAIDTYAANSNQDQDSALGYGVQRGIAKLNVWLDGDVLFVQTITGAQGAFELYVNDSLCTPPLGSGVTAASDGRSYYATADGYFKFKWSSKARRKITLRYVSNCTTPAMYARAADTLLPYCRAPLQWHHLGDSFSQYTGNGASVVTLSLLEWLTRSFGEDFDVINGGNGASSFANGTDNKPGDTPVSGQKASIRTQYLLNLKNCAPNVLTMLVGHNEESGTMTLVASELTALLTQIQQDFPRCLIVVFAGNASPGNIGSLINTIESTMQAACAAFERVIFVPLQTASSGAFLRGTGHVGATTGVGNTDTYTGTDGTHPSDAGHRAYGELCARRMYEALKSL